MQRSLLSSSLLLLCALSQPCSAALTLGDAAPALRAPELGQAAPWDLVSLRGKVIYVDFWATWCAPCRVSLPLLNALRQELAAQGFEVVGVNVEQDTAAVERAVKTQALSYPVLHPVDAEVMQSWQVQAMPSALLIDRQGRVRRVYEGFRASEFAALRKEIEALLGENAP